MCDIYRKLYNSYYLNRKFSYKPVISLKPVDLKNEELIKYANESLKKSIRRIEDRYKDPNYKINCIVKDTLKDEDQDQDQDQDNHHSPFILGATFCFLLLLYINNANSH